MVLMTCCNSRYDTVRESMNHTCPAEKVTVEMVEAARASYEAARFQSENLHPASSKANRERREALTAQRRAVLMDLLDRL